jgi:hypothetical protein
MRRSGPVRLIGLALVLALAGSRPAGAGPDAAASTLADIEAIAAPCPAEAVHCVGLFVHVAPALDGGLAQGPDWVAGQVATANRLFAPLGLGFTITAVRGLADDDLVITTRDDRNRLGRRVTGGVVHVFVVGRLGNIDEAGGEINGVHWRRGGRHWVIVAAKAWDLTLGHELGHFFGLPHSEVAASIMNTTWRSEPPRDQRVFQPDELERMRAGLRRMLRGRALRDHAVPAGTAPPPPPPRRARPRRATGR